VPSLDDATWPVRTDRLLIRRAMPADADATFVYRTLESVRRWIPRHSTDRDAHAERWVSPDWTSRFLVVELDGVVIGDVMLHIEDAWGQVEVADRAQAVQGELGWCLDPAYEGRGYATEAVRALVEVAFGQLGLRRLVANTFADNTASWQLMERLGMRREAHNVRDSLHRSGEWMDGFTYALLASEWASPTAAG